MFFKATQRISNAKLFEIIERVKDAELRRDLESAERLFEPIWNDFNRDPEFEEDLDIVIKAELLRLMGWFLGYSGRSKTINAYHERSKNLLTQSIELFEKSGNKHKRAEAQVVLAMCYWWEGSVNEAEAILNDTETEYQFNQLHPVYLLICVNRLAIFNWRDDFASAFALIDSIKVAVELCADFRLHTMYHTQAGIIYRRTNKTELALKHFLEAVKFATLTNSPRFTCMNLNNLALAYKDAGKYEEAYKYIEQAMILFQKLKEEGFLAHALDTRAAILFHQKKNHAAYRSVCQSIKLFEKGIDYAGLTDALFLRVRILIKLQKTERAFLDFARLVNIANQRIGEFAVERYARELADLVYFRKDIPYADEVRAFRKCLITGALHGAELQIVKAADLLGMSHQNLSLCLTNQFPELYDELNLPRRSRRNSKTPGQKRSPRSSKNPATQPPSKSSAPERAIKYLNTPLSAISFPGSEHLLDKSAMCFLMEGSRLPMLGVTSEMVVLCRPQNEYKEVTIIAQNNSTHKICCAMIGFDVLTATHFVTEIGADLPLAADEFKIYGEIIGYCLVENIDGDRIVFESLPNKI